MKKIGIVGKTGKTEPAEMIKEFLPWLLEQGCEVYIDSETASLAGMKGYPRSEIPALVDMIIVLGGDGTMISVARLVSNRNVAILGVNIGGMGFLTAVQKEDFRDAMKKVLTDNCPVEERMMLSACVFRHSECIAEYIVMNDVVVNKGALARIIDL
ncbi:MAG: NAD(+)/NADH kinase [Thermodesulfovibrionales bacterium]|nr:NAD(+)/NADH kinase [Thermodesulfovibrionales bacterium]